MDNDKNFNKKFEKKYKEFINNERSFDLLYLGASQKHRWKDINFKNNKKFEDNNEKKVLPKTTDIFSFYDQCSLDSHGGRFIKKKDYP